MLSLLGSRAADPPTVLVPGQAVTGSVTEHGYAYYQVAAGQPDQDLTIAVTSLAGDPDLYVSSTISLPTNSDFTWARAHLGGDTITIAYEDSKSCKPDVDPDCKYSIAVYGYAPATFTILANYNGSDPSKLVLGQPQADSVGVGSFRQYAFDVTPDVMQSDGAASDLQVSAARWPEVTFPP